MEGRGKKGGGGHALNDVTNAANKAEGERWSDRRAKDKREMRECSGC